MKYYYALSPAVIGVSIVLISQVALGLSAQEVEQIGKEITVRIVDAQNPSIAGSGVIIKRAGNTYTVLTAYHVVKAATKYQIILPSLQSYAVNNIKPLDKEGDLAIASFSSSNSYKVAKIGDSDKATRTTTVYVAGYPAKSASISNPDYFLNKGQVNANGAAQREGYNILYDNVTRKGMSGGAVLNEQGELIAIHGRADEESITEKSESKIITGLGTTIYSALRQLIAVGVDVGVRPPSINVAAAPKADDFFIKADQKYRDKDFKGAIADYTEAIRLNPNYADAYNDRGIVLHELKDLQGAVADYNSAIKINPNYAEVYNNRGVARKDLKDLQGAVADYTQAIKINPNYAIAYYNLGLVRKELKDLQGAIADYTQAIKINPNYALAYNNRGVVRYDLNDLQGAVADYNSALLINPNYAQAYYNLGVVRYDLKDLQGAVADYNSALTINPNYAIAYNNRGNARKDLKDLQGAVADYNSALTINPNFAEAYGNRGLVRYQLGDKQGAINDLQKAAELFQQQGRTADYQKALEVIRKIQQ
ncbi:tetratricopeptide repeat protein [Hassallia byssoidea VB512170]|uniref:Tetratricopeptide repeat protein n=1 Tax=Hassallia byssoidea VB512170 TaxID=1304833 RepID=A0A846H7M9_9CYAN|nr:serine protease [Hassalia byssoidea]NEU73295.1 tetratricopeptide repeat protein [Hassalia byssoidea VB512170]